MSCIYMITNTVNGMIYIGQTKRSIQRRWYDHVADSTKKNRNDFYYHCPLYEAIREYGADQFNICVIEDNVPDELLDDKERYYIDKYHSCVSDPECCGYNVMVGGRKNSKMSNYDIDAISSMHKSGETMIEIAERFGISRRTVYDILHHEGTYDKSIIKTNMESIKRGVAQIDPNTGKIINVFKSRSEAARFVGACNHSKICDAANGKIRLAYGYIWKNC